MKISLVVKADNSRSQPGSTTENVIPLSADFFIFGGIYRGVALIATDLVHVDMLDFGGPGLYARGVTIDSNSAAVRASATLVNDGSKPGRSLSSLESKATALSSSPRRRTGCRHRPVRL